jgi:hypothetical protein
MTNEEFSEMWRGIIADRKERSAEDDAILDALDRLEAATTMTYEEKRALIDDCCSLDGMLQRLSEDVRFQGNEQTILHALRRVNANVLKLAESIKDNL